VRDRAPTAPSSDGPARWTILATIATAKRMKADGHTGRAIAKYLGVSRATLYRYLAERDAP
jgi:DNA invertase Pin-like site-specific DNA recombinase